MLPEYERPLNKRQAAKREADLLRTEGARLDGLIRELLAVAGEPTVWLEILKPRKDIYSTRKRTIQEVRPGWLLQTSEGGIHGVPGTYLDDLGRLSHGYFHVSAPAVVPTQVQVELVSVAYSSSATGWCELVERRLRHWPRLGPDRSYGGL